MNLSFRRTRGDFEKNVAGIGALADPMRRDLYQYVCAQAGPVGRDEAAAALGIARHQAKFHLDRLEAEGLLVTDYARLTGRTGPGAGRPAKLYRRAEREIAVSLPERHYELAGEIMADAIDRSMRTDAPIRDSLRETASEHGRAMGGGPAGPAGSTGPMVSPVPTDDGADVLENAMGVLAEHGYEPRREADRVIMANCPFHSLTQAHTELVCEMNHALITGFTDAIAPGRIRACLDPGEGRCCVVLTATERAEVGRGARETSSAPTD